MATGKIVPKKFAEFLRAVPYEISGQWFYQAAIQLDGYAFANCRFDNCTITVARGMFRLTSCYFSNCTFVYGDEARNVVRLFAAMHIPPNTVALHPLLMPTYNADGTLTIDPLNK